MYHLGSQQKTDGTLKLVNSNQVYLHRCRRIIRDIVVTQGKQQQRGGRNCHDCNQPILTSWVGESYTEGCHEFIAKDLQLWQWSRDTVSLRWSPAGKESIPNLTSSPTAGASHWLKQMARAPMEAIEVCLLGWRVSWRNRENECGEANKK